MMLLLCLLSVLFGGLLPSMLAALTIRPLSFPGPSAAWIQPLVAWGLFLWLWLPFATVSVGGTLQHAVLGILLLLAALIDAHERRIPNRLLAWAAVASVILWIWWDPAHLFVGLLAAASVGASLLVLRWGSIRWWGQPGFGMGDVKLLMVLALLLGWQVYWILYLAALLGAGAGLFLKARERAAKPATIPFAPFLGLGTLLYLQGLSVTWLWAL